VPEDELELYTLSNIKLREEWKVGNWPVVLQVGEVNPISLQQRPVT